VGTTIFTVMSGLAAEKNAVNLGQGFPDFNCDPKLLEDVTAAMAAGHNQYPPMPGIPALRDAIAGEDLGAVRPHVQRGHGNHRHRRRHAGHHHRHPRHRAARATK
jgi:hypothetical protein